MSDIAYHLTAREYYESTPPDQQYVPEPFDEEGFIHCTDALDEVIKVANQYYRDDRREYVLLAIDKDRVEAEVRYDDAAHAFPHIYGALNRDAIVRVHQVLRDANGRFVAAVIK